MTLRKKKSVGFLKSAILILNIFSASFLLLAYLAPWVSPNTFWPVAFFGISYPILLIINCLFFLFWLFRKSLLFLLSLIVIVIGWSSLQKNIGFRFGTDNTKKHDAALRLMTYNVHMFRSFEEDHSLNTKKEILGIFQDVNPDVLCLQEFYTRKKGKNDLKTKLNEDFGFEHNFFLPVAENEYDAYGIAIFSKFPIVRSGYISMQGNNPGQSRLLYADIKVEGKEIRIYNIHLKSIGFKPEDYEFIRKANTDMEEDLSSTKRIGGRLKRAFQERAEEVDALSQHMEACSIPFLVAGDFNDTPLSYAVNKVGKKTQNAFVEKGTGWGVTYNGDFPNFQIDYIMASGAFQVESYSIIQRKLSDHFPIWSDLTIKGSVIE